MSKKLEDLKKQLSELNKEIEKVQQKENEKEINELTKEILLKKKYLSSINNDKKVISNKVIESSNNTIKNVANNSKPIITLKNIKKEYMGKVVIKDLSLEINKGDRIAIIGPNGAGKTTLMEIISGIKEPTSGSVEYSFGNTKKDISKNIGIQFQETSFPKMTVYTIIELFAKLRKTSLTKDQIKKLTAIFAIDEFINTKADKLSGGQKKRLNSLLCILHKPSIIILDEIAAGLDTKSWSVIKAFLMEYIEQNNITVLTVSHTTDEIVSFTNRVILLNEGEIKSNLTLSQIQKQYGSFPNYLESIFKANKIVENLDFMKGVN